MNDAEQNTNETGGLIGDSPPMEALRSTIRNLGKSVATVLVIGETGTGKELIARAIHKVSKRTGEFIPVHCGGLNKDLIESELFGYERGAFTGANERREGLVRAASAGTLFLDEINSTDTTFQTKLLRVLQERVIVRVGGIRPEPVDVRVIAASNLDLVDAMNSGRFREDLYHRLCVIRIIAPPLRSRCEDVQPLACHFLQEFSTREGKRFKGFGPHAISEMNSYSWPGNVRELANTVERAVVLTNPKALSDGLLDIDIQVLTSAITESNDTGQIEHVANVVLDSLLDGRPPLEGIRNRSQQIGPLATLVIDGLIKGFGRYLATEDRQLDLKNLANGAFMTRLGLGERPGGSETLFIAEVRRRVTQLLDEHRRELGS